MYSYLLQRINWIHLLFTALLFPTVGFTQDDCPPNIDFENGEFENWNLSTGHIAEDGTYYLTPSRGNHQLYSTRNFTQKDVYGDFEISPPDGSIFCVKIGTEIPDQKIDQLAYSFSVPATSKTFSIIFNYAIVFQNADHEENEQPRFTVKVFNVTKNEYIECSSFNFVGGYSQPGFLISEKDRNVSYKPWASAAINLHAFAGDQLRLEFTVNDCSKGGHFGYAYIDIADKCSNSITGNIICEGVDDVTLHAPDNFAGYKWYTGNFSEMLSKDEVYTAQNPRLGDSLALVLIPFSYLGCRDTLYTKITSLSDSINLIVKDTITGCIDEGIDLTSKNVISGSSSFLTFEYYSDAAAGTKIADPVNIKSSGIYYIRAVNAAGCAKTEPVVLNIADTPAFKVHDPDIVRYPNTVNLTSAADNQSLVYTYWKNAAMTDPVLNPAAIKESGIYYINGTNAAGCSAIAPVEVKIEPVLLVPNSFTPDGNGINDRFVFNAGGNFKELSYLKIFNRYGQEIFNTSDMRQSWDGTFKGKPVEGGTYIWILKATDWLGKLHTAKGTAVLIR